MKKMPNRNKKEERPEGDFYQTPKSLVWVAKDIIDKEFTKHENGKQEKYKILEPCHGDGAISSALMSYGYEVQENDLFRGGVDYLTNSFERNDGVITNPPFSLWDEFVIKSKKDFSKVMMIGRLNYLGTASRLRSGVWNNLKSIHIFNRYVDFRTPPREDGLFHVGAMTTGWFLWDNEHEDDPVIRFLDVNCYAKLGQFKV